MVGGGVCDLDAGAFVAVVGQGVDVAAGERVGCPFVKGFRMSGESRIAHDSETVGHESRANCERAFITELT